MLFPALQDLCRTRRDRYTDFAVGVKGTRRSVVEVAGNHCSCTVKAGAVGTRTTAATAGAADSSSFVDSHYSCTIVAFAASCTTEVVTSSYCRRA